MTLLIAGLSNNLTGQNTILWKAEHPDKKTQSYLLGTFHQMGNSFVDSLPQIKTLLANADIAFFETIDDTDQLRAKLNQRNQDFTYREVLSRAETKFLELYAEDWAVPISKLTPIELYIKLNQEYTLNICGTAQSNDSWRHFDKYLIYLAEVDNITVQGFESDSLQTVDINNMAADYDWQSAGPDISEILRNIKNSRTNTTECEHANQYMNFNLNYSFEEQCSNANIIERNNKWMPVIIETLADQNAFIAVGLLHLFGQCGLIEQLRENGYKVDPIMLEK